MSASENSPRFVPIQVSNLRGDQPIAFNAYVKINDRYILYLREGDSFEGPRLQRLREKKLRQMYVDIDQEARFQTYLRINRDTAFDAMAGKSLEIRCQIVQGIQQSSIEALFENPESSEHYGQTKADCERFVNFLAKEAEAAGLLLQIENLDRSVAQHGVSVSTLATALALKVNKVDARQLQMISLGALMHDFDHFRSGFDVQRPRDRFSPEEKEAYRQHPLEGARQIQKLNHIDSQVIKIMAQHEEYMDGTGFPQGLPLRDLDPLSLYVAAANALDRLITFEGVSLDQAGVRYLRENLGRYPLDYMNILVKIVSGAPRKDPE